MLFVFSCFDWIQGLITMPCYRLPISHKHVSHYSTGIQLNSLPIKSKGCREIAARETQGITQQGKGPAASSVNALPGMQAGGSRSKLHVQSQSCSIAGIAETGWDSVVDRGTSSPQKSGRDEEEGACPPCEGGCCSTAKGWRMVGESCGSEAEERPTG